jgi:SsrA-binding protein
MRIFNRKARFNYVIIETLEAGIVLSGFEVKSIRMGRVDLSDSFARVENGEVVLKNMYIHPFQNPPQGYIPNKDRKLLLHKKQINTLIGKSAQSGITLIPLSLYTKRNLVKIEIGLGASKKKYDKRRAIKARDEQRRMDQEIKY